MKVQKLRELTPEELQNKHDELWSELFGMRIKHSLGQLESPIELRAKRRDIARVKTLLAEHGIEETSRRRRSARPAATKPKATKSAKSGADK
jgi:large subunit ribosomal protein L29